MNAAVKKLPDIELDEYGLLKQPQDWNKEVALVLAKSLDINRLTMDHWKVIDAMRKHYDMFGVAPAIHNICHSNQHSDEWVHGLFGTCLNAWRVAGLPDPGEEAKAYLNDM
jgi:dissimilatory sulfite reductase related protein